MEAAVASFEVLSAMAEEGLMSSVSDAGVGAFLARAAVRGAGLNVQINAAGLDGADAYLTRAAELEEAASAAEAAVLATVDRRIGEAS